MTGVLLHVSIDDGEQRLVFKFEKGDVTGVFITDDVGLRIFSAGE
jgi:hypothetical protein